MSRPRPLWWLLATIGVLLVGLGCAPIGTAAAAERPLVSRTASYSYDASTNGSVVTLLVSLGGAVAGGPSEASSAGFAGGVSAVPVGIVAAETGTGAFSRYAVDAAGNTTIRVRNASETFDLTEHAAQRATQRGISIDQIENTVGGHGFRYYNKGAGVYRPMSYKDRAGIWQANLEGRVPGQVSKEPMSNAHIDILDPP